uniref:Uncharacterized protein n=1 Tax=virus sp. ctML55 TaxID=2827627 RepID=A0A8S5RIK9_9VIRU|nr:MAG TPA: hypothetical protein [virus sp. ctML55]
MLYLLLNHVLSLGLFSIVLISYLYKYSYCTLFFYKILSSSC